MRISPREPARHDNGASDVWALTAYNGAAIVKMLDLFRTFFSDSVVVSRVNLVHGYQRAQSIKFVIGSLSYEMWT